MNENLKQKIKRNKKKIIISLLLAVALAGVFVLGYFVHFWTMPPSLRELYEVFGVADGHYDGDVNVDDTQLIKGVVNEVFDEYSEYYSQEEYQTIAQNARGNYAGVGVSFLKATASDENEFNRVYKVTGNSPAEKAGILSGDKIVSGAKSGQSLTAFTSRTQLTAFLTALEIGDAFVLSVTREGEFTQKQFELVKSEYQVSYVKYYDSEKALNFFAEGLSKPQREEGVNDGAISGLNQKTAYVSLTSFEGNCAEQLGECLDYMGERGRDTLILDLRDNGGGYMTVLQDVASYLIKDGQNKTAVIAYAKNKQGKFTEYKSSECKYRAHVKKIIVLANENTASASECLITAMLHYGSGQFSLENLVITKGQNGVARTFGKGVMQTTYRLSSGAALKITTAHLYLPDRTTCINGKGVVVSGANGVSGNANALARAISLANA